jgi:hypothetical protein
MFNTIPDAWNCIIVGIAGIAGSSPRRNDNIFFWRLQVLQAGVYQQAMKQPRRFAFRSLPYVSELLQVWQCLQRFCQRSLYNTGGRRLVLLLLTPPSIVTSTALFGNPDPFAAVVALVNAGWLAIPWDRAR